jgi:hypothetical protein
VHLTKCLDAEASCELRVNQVSNERLSKRALIPTPVYPRHSKDTFQPTPKNNGGTKSEFQFPLTNNNKPSIQLYPREEANLTIRSPALSRSPNNTFRKAHREQLLPEFGGTDASSRSKLIEAEVYKESYYKLKEKYKK